MLGYQKGVFRGPFIVLNFHYGTTDPCHIGAPHLKAPTASKRPAIDLALVHIA